MSTSTIRIDSHLGDGAPRSLADDVLDGLTRPFKELQPKHLYDSVGADLFDQICELPEYYPTRTERAILEADAAAIVEATGAAELVELGSGTAAKTRVLLDAMRDAGTLRRYVPFDVAQDTLRECATAIVDEYPGIEVHGIVGDFERHLACIPAPEPGVPRLLGDDGHLLLGTDLVKDVATLEAAYDDAAGVTAAFNLNLLTVLNRELAADFPVEDFEHVAFFDTQHEWIEMRLRARRGVEVRIGALGLEVRFRRGEELRTEISAKFTRERVQDDLGAAGLELTGWHTDERGWFALSLARPA